jgi:FlaA1/EpsC-like NDP-sugar epimerase
MKPAFQIRNRLLLIVDLLLIVTSVLASFALRLDLGPVFSAYLPSAWVMVVIALIVKPIVYYLFGLYRRYWVYASIRELRLIALATIAASVCVAYLGWHAGRVPSIGARNRLAPLVVQRRRTAYGGTRAV